MSSQKRRNEEVDLTNESVNAMFSANPRTLRRVDVDTICLREVTQAEMSTRLVACAPSVFTEARTSWCAVTMFDAWHEIMPVIELNLPEPHPRRHAVAGPGWILDLITLVRFDCPLIACSVNAEATAVELITARDERIPVRSEWCSGCN
ncbi:MAG: hypothetical protein Kow0074_21000 [Candidatus Zixiibacteriota bacterium]